MECGVDSLYIYIVFIDMCMIIIIGKKGKKSAEGVRADTFTKPYRPFVTKPRAYSKTKTKYSTN